MALLILLGIFRYLAAGKPEWLQAPYDAPRMGRDSSVWGNEVSHLAFLRDKRAYFYQEAGVDQLFLLYRQKADKLLVMGEPIGNQDNWRRPCKPLCTMPIRRAYGRSSMKLVKH